MNSCLLALAWVLASVGVEASGKATIRIGDKFPNLAEFGLEGDLPALAKGKLVIVDFWASWCGPCRGTFPLMESLHRRWGKQGLVIVAVNEDKSQVAETEFLKQHPVTFTVVRDPRKKLAAAVNVPILPCSYILDSNGKVLSIQSGERTMENRAVFVKRVEELLAQQSLSKQ